METKVEKRVWCLLFWHWLFRILLQNVLHTHNGTSANMQLKSLYSICNLSRELDKERKRKNYAVFHWFFFLLNFETFSHSFRMWKCKFHWELFDTEWNERVRWFVSFMCTAKYLWKSDPFFAHSSAASKHLRCENEWDKADARVLSAGRNMCDCHGKMKRQTFMHANVMNLIAALGIQTIATLINSNF